MEGSRERERWRVERSREDSRDRWRWRSGDLSRRDVRSRDDERERRPDLSDEVDDVERFDERECRDERRLRSRLGDFERRRERDSWLLFLDSSTIVRIPSCSGTCSCDTIICEGLGGPKTSDMSTVAASAFSITNERNTSLIVYRSVSGYVSTLVQYTLTEALPTFLCFYQ